MAWKNVEGDLYPYSAYERLERTLSARQMFFLEFFAIAGVTALIVFAIFSRTEKSLLPLPRTRKSISVK